jgi:antirestriction protein ArdC
MLSTSPAALPVLCALNGQPDSVINVLSLWMSTLGQNFAAPIWTTLKQASELDAHIRQGEKGSLVVYADSITRKETDEKTGDETDREIPFLKGYTVFSMSSRSTACREELMGSYWR